MEVFIRIFFGTSFLLVLVFEMIITGEGKMDMSQLLLLGKFEYGGGPIFKVVLEC